jgi:hypothetical protein
MIAATCGPHTRGSAHARGRAPQAGARREGARVPVAIILGEGSGWRDGGRRGCQRVRTEREDVLAANRYI